MLADYPHKNDKRETCSSSRHFINDPQRFPPRDITKAGLWNESSMMIYRVRLVLYKKSLNQIRMAAWEIKVWVSAIKTEGVHKQQQSRWKWNWGFHPEAARTYVCVSYATLIQTLLEWNGALNESHCLRFSFRGIEASENRQSPCRGPVIALAWSKLKLHSIMNDAWRRNGAFIESDVIWPVNLRLNPPDCPSHRAWSFGMAPTDSL